MTTTMVQNSGFQPVVCSVWAQVSTELGNLGRSLFPSGLQPCNSTNGSSLYCQGLKEQMSAFAKQHGQEVFPRLAASRHSALARLRHLSTGPAAQKHLH